MWEGLGNPETVTKKFDPKLSTTHLPDLCEAQQEQEQEQELELEQDKQYMLKK